MDFIQSSKAFNIFDNSFCFLKGAIACILIPVHRSISGAIQYTASLHSRNLTDGNYMIQYGVSSDHLDQEFVSNVRGMVSIDLDGEREIYFKMKRMKEREESNWSQLVKVAKR